MTGTDDLSATHTDSAAHDEFLPLGSLPAMTLLVSGA